MIRFIARWCSRLCRKPWYALYINEDFEKVEKRFWLESSCRKWAHSFGKHDEGYWKASYAYMWSLKSK